MERGAAVYQTYVSILKQELIPAMGCTEPIAIAYCAAKISLAVDAGIFGYEMFQNGQQFYSGDGIVSKGVENTIHNVNILGKEGMLQTDKTIIAIMANS